MRLNASALSDPNSLCIPLVSPLVCALDHLQPIPIRTLVDSGSTHCFLDSAFACGHSLSTTPTPPVELHLFDGTSNNIISEVVSLPVKFPSGECMTLDFYVIPLDPCCSLVLGHSWLTRYNLLIDWVSRSISFRPPSVLQSLASVPPVKTLVNPPFSPAENPLQLTPSETLPSNPQVTPYRDYQCASPTPGLASLRLENIFPPILLHNIGQIHHHLRGNRPLRHSRRIPRVR